MRLKKKEPAKAAADVAGESEHLKDIAKLLYEQNAELAVRNKTLSLLKKLYQFSILTLDPEAIADKITEAIRKDLGYELVAIMTFDEAKDELIPLKFARSERLSEARKSATEQSFKSIKISRALDNEILNTVINEKTMANAFGLKWIWRGALPENVLDRIDKKANIKASLIYPLVIENRTIGILIMCLNHEYVSLGKFEKESIDSFVNVIAVALDRAFLYQKIRIANEKLKELDKLKSEFLSFASHQIKTPMAIVKGFAELISEGAYGPIPEKVMETSRKIKAAADKMIDLVNDFLNIRKIEAGKMDYNMEEIDINKFVGDIVEDLKTLANSKKLSLSFDTSVPNAKVKVDQQKFRQVIQNYTENAIKYTPSGWVKVSIDKDDKDANSVIITVSDSGLGMSKELIPQLFQQFHRDSNTAKKILGTGLGLFIAKNIIEGHGGKTWAESDGEGKGSRFYIRLKSL